HDMHKRRCSHWAPMRRQSSHPSLLGTTSATWSRWLHDWVTRSSWVRDDRRADRQAAQQQHVEWLGLAIGRGDDEMVAGPEHNELSALDRSVVGPYAAAARQ